MLNYTDAQTSQLVSAYIANPTRETVEAFAELFGRTARSIVAKLAHEKVYQKQASDPRASQNTTKADLVKNLATALNVEYASLKSLEKADKATLVALQKFIE